MLVMRCPFTGGRREPAQTLVVEAVRGWALRPPAVALWLLCAAEYVTPQDDAELVVEYDADLGLVSCEAWVAGRRVFAIDDLAVPA